MAPDYSKYFVTCENTGEVIVVDAHNDKVLARIRVGNFAQELAVSYKLNKVFVTCMEEPSNLPQDIVGRYKGTVAVIDIATYNKETITAKFSQPHGIAVDDINGYLYVASRNTTGVQPHHPSACAGNNGYYQVFELNTTIRHTPALIEGMRPAYSPILPM
jgi:DNA-binding beta-propeller fold protein YncE